MYIDFYKGDKRKDPQVELGVALFARCLYGLVPTSWFVRMYVLIVMLLLNLGN